MTATGSALPVTHAEEAVRRLRQGRAPRGLFFDFDGVLAAIHEDPEAALPPPQTLATVYRLASLVERVAVVSARPVSFLARHIDDPAHVALFGLYGLESRGSDGEPRTDARAEQAVPLIQELSRRAHAELPELIRVENKRLALALHYRRAPQLRPAVEEWATAVAAETGLHRVDGRMVVELRPPGHDKGAVIEEQIVDLASAWYFGDDVSDLAAFNALTRRSEADRAFVGVRVAVANPESGNPLDQAADLVVESPEALLALLTVLADELSSS